MNTGDILLETILDDPSDIDARLVYGDYLAEIEDPRGEFIQCEVATERLPRWSPEFADLHFRARELEQQHRKNWDKEIQSIIGRMNFSTRDNVYRARPPIDYKYRIGFADQFSLNQFPINKEVFGELLRTTPIRKIKPSSEVELRLLDPMMSKISELEIHAASISNKLARLFSPSAPYRLKSLRLYLQRASAKERTSLAKLLVKSETTQELESFYFNATATKPNDLQKLIDAPMFANLNSLGLIEGELGDEGISMISRSHLIKQLHSLHIKMSGVGDDGIVELANAGPEKLKYLSMGWWFGKNPTSIGLRALANCEALQALETMDLRGYRIDPSGFEALAQSKCLTSLRDLDLEDSDLDDQGAKALAGSKLKFGRLNLAKNRALDADGLTALLHSDVVSELTHLSLECALPRAEKVTEIIATSPVMKNLRHLDLCDSEITTESIRTLAESDNLQELRELHLGFVEDPKSEIAKLLKQKSHFPSLKFLNFVTAADGKVSQSLRQRFYPATKS